MITASIHKQPLSHLLVLIEPVALDERVSPLLLCCVIVTRINSLLIRDLYASHNQVFLLSEWGLLVFVAEIACHGNCFLLAASSILELLKMWVGDGGGDNLEYFGISVGSGFLFQNRPWDINRARTVSTWRVDNKFDCPEMVNFKVKIWLFQFNISVDNHYLIKDELS